MKFKGEFLKNYLLEAPAALALERTLECEILSKLEFERPILDVGCGEGLFAYMLFDEQIDTGIDPNLSEINKAQSYGMYRELINCYGNDIPKEAGTFRTVFSNSVLEHIEELLPVLQEINRLMMDEGVFYATVPSIYFDKYSVIYQLLNGLGMSDTAGKYSRFFNKFWRHFHYYDLEGWKKLFRESGFEIVDVRMYGQKRACLLNDIMSFFALPSFACKKLLNRWFFSKHLRRFYAPILSRLLNHIANNDTHTEQNGLIFFKMIKVSTR